MQTRKVESLKHQIYVGYRVFASCAIQSNPNHFRLVICVKNVVFILICAVVRSYDGRLYGSVAACFKEHLNGGCEALRGLESNLWDKKLNETHMNLVF